MGDRGPARKPTNVLALHSKKARRSKKREPKPASGPGDPPAHLSKAAREHWKKLVKKLEDAGLVTDWDTDALEIYCDSFVLWREAQKKVAKEGAVLETEKGYKYQNPWIGIAKDRRAACFALLKQFGLSPSARAGLTVPQQDTGPKKGSYGAFRNATKAG